MPFGATAMFPKAGKQAVPGLRKPDGPTHETQPGEPGRHAGIGQGLGQVAPNRAEPPHGPQAGLKGKHAEEQHDEPDARILQ